MRSKPLAQVQQGSIGIAAATEPLVMPNIHGTMPPSLWPAPMPSWPPMSALENHLIAVLSDTLGPFIDVTRHVPRHRKGSHNVERRQSAILATRCRCHVQCSGASAVHRFPSGLRLRARRCGRRPYRPRSHTGTEVPLRLRMRRSTPTRCRFACQLAHREPWTPRIGSRPQGTPRLRWETPICRCRTASACGESLRSGPPPVLIEADAQAADASIVGQPTCAGSILCEQDFIGVVAGP